MDNTEHDKFLVQQVCLLSPSSLCPTCKLPNIDSSGDQTCHIHMLWSITTN